MLKGHVFNLQTFTSEAFAITFDRVLQGRCGILKGCELSSTNNSATIGEGYFVVRGRPLQVVGNESVSNITNNGYYSLVCEIDLSKTNTEDTLNQAEIKTVYNANSYPTLTQQDITGSGLVYQYEFARFQVSGGNIINFTDRRTYLDFETLYDLVEDTLEGLENESNVMLKTGGTITGNLEVTGTITGNLTGSATQLGGRDSSQYIIKGDFAIITGTLVEGTDDYEATVNLPSGFTATNCVIISAMAHNPNNSTNQWGTGTVFNSSSYTAGGVPLMVRIGDTGLTVKMRNILFSTEGTAQTAYVNKGSAYEYKVVLMKTN